MKGTLATANNILNSISKTVSYLNLWKSPLSFELQPSSNRLSEACCTLNTILSDRHVFMESPQNTRRLQQLLFSFLVQKRRHKEVKQLAWAHSYTRILSSYLYLRMFSLSLEETSLMVLVIAIFWGGEPDNWGTEGQRWEEVCFPLKTLFCNFWSPSFTLLRIFREPDT